MSELNPLYVPTINGTQQVRHYVKVSPHFAAHGIVGTANIPVMGLTHIGSGLSAGHYSPHDVGRAAAFLETQADWSKPFAEIEPQVKNLWQTLNGMFRRYAGAYYYKTYTGGR